MRPSGSAHRHHASSSTGGALPPLRAGGGGAAALSLPVGSVPASDLGRAYDFELRSVVPSASTSGGPAPTSGAGGGLSGVGGRGAISTVKGFSALSPTVARDAAAVVRARPGASMDTFGSSAAAAADGFASQGLTSPWRGLSSSASTSTLPSHLTSTAEKLEYFLSWNKGWTAEGSDATGATVAGVLTPRTRYDRLAQSVAAVPFTTPSHQHMQSEESKQESAFASPSRTAARRTLGASASSPALMFGSPTRTLGSSISYSSLHGPPAGMSSTSSSSADLHQTSTSHLSAGAHRPPRIPSLFMPPSQFLSAFLPDSSGVGEAVRQENTRAKGQQEKWNILMQARKQRKKSKKAAQRAAGLIAGAGSDSESSSDSPDDFENDFVVSSSSGSASSLAKSTRKPGLTSGSAILRQIESIVKAVQEEKQQMMEAALSANSGPGGAAAGAKGKKKKRDAGAGGADGNSSDEDEQASSAQKGAKSSSGGASAQLTKAEDAQLQSVIQSYMVSTGLAGSVAAGGASSAGGSGGGGAIKDRDGSSTFTTAKITRDVKLILDYLKTNPVMRQDLMARVHRRAQAKMARQMAAQRQAASLGQDGLQMNKVRQNAVLAWHQTADTREALRLDGIAQQKARRQRQLANKAEIDSVWYARAQERDAQLMQSFGPEMMARRQRENAEHDRLAHVGWGWIMLSQLIPITLRLKWKMREIIQARLTRQVASFVTPAIQRSYVVNVTYQLNESRAKALEKIRRSLVRYVIRWKWLKRRNACLQVWKFLTLVKNAYAIRQGLKDSSLRSQIIKVQMWWRATLNVIQSQAMLVELAWNRRETHLIKTWTKKQKKDERAQKLRKSAGRGGSMGSPQSAGPRGRMLGGGDGTRDFTQTLASFDFRAGAEEQMERDAAQGLAPKKIPLKLKREVIMKFVKRRRALFRQALRNHVHDVAAWQDEHKYDIELRKARTELGVKTGGASSAAAASAAASAARSSPGFAPSDLEPPARPTLRLLPGAAELEHMILTASKQYVLSKLRGAMHESAMEAAAAAIKSASTQRSQGQGGGSTSRSSASHHAADGSATASASSATATPTYNALVGFVAGNSNATNLGLKPMTIAEQQRAKREMLEKIEDGDEE